MTRSTALGMLKVGNTGDEILQILDVIVADIAEQNNIALQKLNDAISAQSVAWEWYWRGDTFSPFFSNNYLQKVLKNVLKWLNKYTLPFYLVENSSLDTTQ